MLTIISTIVIPFLGGYLAHHLLTKKRYAQTTHTEIIRQLMFSSTSFFHSRHSNEWLPDLPFRFFIDALMRFLNEPHNIVIFGSRVSFIFEQFSDKELIISYDFLIQTMAYTNEQKLEAYSEFLTDVFKLPQLCALAFRNSDEVFLKFCDVETCLQTRPDLFV